MNLKKKTPTNDAVCLLPDTKKPPVSFVNIFDTVRKVGWGWD
jgi:hypothetical protein